MKLQKSIHQFVFLKLIRFNFCKKRIAKTVQTILKDENIKTIPPNIFSISKFLVSGHNEAETIKLEIVITRNGSKQTIS